jgi:hypothetical protein
MNRRFLFCAMAAAAVLCAAGTADAKHHCKDLCFKLKMKCGFRTNGNACEAYAGDDAGPTDCGCASTSGCDDCCKPKRHWLGSFRKHKGCMPAECEPACEAPAPCDTCDSCGDPCCRPRPLRDFFAALHSCCRSLCADVCDPCGCGSPEPSCGCGH